MTAVGLYLWLLFNAHESALKWNLWRRSLVQLSLQVVRAYALCVRLLTWVVTLDTADL